MIRRNESWGLCGRPLIVRLLESQTSDTLQEELKRLYRTGLITREIGVKTSGAPKHKREFSDIYGGTKFLFSKAATQLTGFLLAPSQKLNGSTKKGERVGRPG